MKQEVLSLDVKINSYRSPIGEKRVRARLQDKTAGIFRRLPS